MNGRFGGAGLLVLTLLSGCMSKEARSAGAVGCSPDEVEVSDERRHGLFVQSGETWIASCRGRTFVCTQINDTPTESQGSAWAYLLGADGSSDQVTCREQAETPEEEENREARRLARLREGMAPPPAPAVAPRGVGGFDFGITSEEAQRRCEAAGHVWSAPKGEVAQCSGTPVEIGASAHAWLRFCEGRACSVTLEHQPSGSWSREVVSLKARLEAKYGPAKASTRGIPTECRAEAAFRACLESRRLELTYSWQWASGEGLKMAVGKAAPSAPSGIRLTYQGPGSGVDASAL